MGHRAANRESHEQRLPRFTQREYSARYLPSTTLDEPDTNVNETPQPEGIDKVLLKDEEILEEMPFPGVPGDEKHIDRRDQKNPQASESGNPQDAWRIE